jgi:hypothetical protein
MYNFWVPYYAVFFVTFCKTEDCLNGLFSMFLRIISQLNQPVFTTLSSHVIREYVQEQIFNAIQSPGLIYLEIKYKQLE